MTALFDAVDYPASPAPHACAGSACQVCELTRTSADAKHLGTTRTRRDPAWWAEATRWLDRQPVGLTFTADDLTQAVGLPDGSSNQVGAIVRTWAVQDLIEPIGYTESTRLSNHGRVLRIWQVAR